MEKTKLCRFYASSGSCFKGDSCPFSHAIVEEGKVEMKSKGKESKDKVNIIDKRVAVGGAGSSNTSFPKSNTKLMSGEKIAETRKKDKPFNRKDNNNNNNNNYNNNNNNNSNNNNYNIKNNNNNNNINNNKNNNNYNNNPKSNPLGGKSVASDVVYQFIIKMSERYRNKSKSIVEIFNESQMSLFFEAWEAIASNCYLKREKDLIISLPIALLQLPSTHNSFPSLNAIIKVMRRFTNIKGSDSLDINDLQIVCDVIKKVKIHLDESLEENIVFFPTVIPTMKELVTSFINCVTMMLTRNPDKTDKIAYLLSRKVDFDSLLALMLSNSKNNLKFVKNEEVDVVDELHLHWKTNPTVGWLMDNRWHSIPPLKNVYENSSEYGDTLLKMWTLLTFYWGSGAVYPKCRNNSNAGKDTMCNQPLLTTISHGGSNRCSTYRCEEVAVYECFRHGHDQMCRKCLHRSQMNLVGHPSPQSSTDIYDARIDKEFSRREGACYLISEMKSRKPPTINPNWKSSYRLQVSCLIGIIKLSASSEELSRNHKIYWAEIIPYDLKPGSLDDSTYREKGKMAFRLLSSNDIPIPQLNIDFALDSGTRIAIIDLRVFVPEVISILKTFASDNFKENLADIPFIEALIGNAVAGGVSTFDYNKELTHSEIILSAIESSKIDFIRRLDASEKIELVKRICTLPQVKLLYGTQLEAFAHGLSSSVHACQGPPGTGKSFIGVALVLALTLVKDFAAEKNVFLGPILMLSYKNHALDEILCDIIKFSPFKIKAGTLIRSGKPENPILSDFSEKASAYEKEAENKLTTRLGIVRRSQKFAKELREVAELLLNRSNFEIMSEKKYSGEIFPVESYYILASLKLVLRFDVLFDFNECLVDGLKAFNCLVDINLNDIIEEGLSHILENLIGASEHWFPNNSFDFSEKLIFWLEGFIDGKVPPPRCEGKVTSKDGKSESRCPFKALKDKSFCTELHQCNSSNEIACNNERISSKIDYCIRHKCEDANCHYEKFQSFNLCESHICHICLESNANLIVSRGREKSCNKHKCKRENCKSSVLFPYNFCLEHCCVICFENRFKSEVNEKLDNSLFCAKHNCSAVGCLKIRYLDSNLCSDHICVICFKRDSKPFGQIINNSEICLKHKCHHPTECFFETENDSLFCLAHSCIICMDIGKKVTSPVIFEAPRNVCIDHTLCTFVFASGNLCRSLSFNNTPYCERHLMVDLRKKEAKPKQVIAKNVVKGDGFCYGITKKKKRCGTKGINLINGGKYYCNDHKSQEVVEEEAKEIEEEEVEEEEEEEEEDDDKDEDEEDEDDEEEQKHNRSLIFTQNIPLPQQPVSIQCCGTMQSSSRQRCIAQTILLPNKSNSKRWFCCLHDDKDTPNKIDLAELIKSKESLVNVLPKPSNLLPPPLQVTQVLNKKEEKVDLNNDIDLPFLPFENMNDNDHLVVDDVNQNIHPDELEYESDEMIDDENADVVRLKEITTLEVSDEEEEEEVDFDSFSSNNLFFKEFEVLNEETAVAEVQKWTWEMPLQERLKSTSKMLIGISNCLRKLRNPVETHVNAARRDKAEAGAKAYKNAKIVGATIVGASRRLEAIRAAEPFAVVVEEACEVMEPTLMSVLAVKSLQKLELVGDHRQLPAFVQNCWYSLETTHPSIKTSLFERLISGISNNKEKRKSIKRKVECLPFTVLDEQRRMRSSIADITRVDYVDIVDIIDHRGTKTQKIGDHLVNSNNSFMIKKQKENFLCHKNLWNRSTRYVPCILPTIFFWDIEGNKEGRPIGGLSACNPIESAAVTSLVTFLLLSGVPPSSISIITPYKGQKNLITKNLRKEKCLPFFNRDSNNQNNDLPITISTVDRYQGDENDIVILSLVKTSPGNRFVGLLNRFIVALSRARLGFYIIGNVDAVIKNRKGLQGPEHWNRFIEHLEKPHEEDIPAYDGPRVGSSLPIVCPRHLESRLNIENSDQFPSSSTWNKFCDYPCSHVLPKCNHNCSEKCHSPLVIPHTTKCNEIVERPCVLHSRIKLVCHMVRGESNLTLKESLDRFQCEVEVPFTRGECNHVELVTCYKNTGLHERGEMLPPCTKNVQDFIHPICGHSFKNLKCFERQSYELRAPDCVEKVDYRKKCGCISSMMCFETLKEDNSLSNCNASINTERCRCNHTISTKCNIATKTKVEWKRNTENLRGFVAVQVREDGTVIVKYDNIYGPVDYFTACGQPVIYQAVCGHEMKVKCDDGFRFANRQTNPPLCKAISKIVNPFCGHEVKLECYVINILQQFDSTCFLKRSSIDQDYILVSESDLDSLHCKLESKILKIIERSCSRSIEVLRSCGHITEIKCNQILNIILKREPLPKCKVKINRLLDCSHFAEQYCHLKFESPPICRQTINEIFQFSCKNHSVEVRVCNELTVLKNNAVPCSKIVTVDRFRCGHTATVKCFQTNLIADPMPMHTVSSFVPSNPIEASKDETLIYYNGNYCDSNSDINLPACQMKVSFVLECNHTIKNVFCFVAFNYASLKEQPPKCKEKVIVRSNLCGHLVTIPCYLKNYFIAYQAWEEGEIPGVLDSFNLRVVDENECPKPAAFPANLNHNLFNCSGNVLLIRLCGHTKTVCCKSAFVSLEKCNENVTNKCKNCGDITSLPCGSDLNNDCQNKVNKPCTICKINSVNVECSEKVIECRSLVKRTLDCGHEVEYNCGVQIVSICSKCNLTKWEKVINFDPQEADRFALINGLKLLEKEAIQSFELINKLELPVDVSNFIAARKSIFSTCYEILKKRPMDYNLTDPINSFLIPPALFATEEELKKYHLVYQVIDNVNIPNLAIGSDELKKYLIKFSMPCSTDFGNCTNLFNFDSSKSFDDIEIKGSDSLTVIVGVVFVNNVYESNLKFKPKKNKKKGSHHLNKDQLANLKQKEVEKLGFDCCLYTEDEEKAKKISKTNHYYFNAGSILPLSICNFKLLEECGICNENVSRSKGVLCNEKHFVCHECFLDHIKSVSENESNKFTDRDGNVLCPFPDCKLPYNIQLLSLNENFPEELFNGLMNVKSSLREKIAYREAAMAEQKKMELEMKRILAIKDREERQAEVLVMEIIENIWLLKCPGCKVVFEFVDGCFAITCLNCRIGFCAWCLLSQGADAHAHVPSCVENKTKGSVHGRMEDFYLHQDNKRAIKIMHRLKNEKKEIRGKVIQKLKKEFKELNNLLKEDEIEIESLINNKNKATIEEEKNKVGGFLSYLGW